MPEIKKSSKQDVPLVFLKWLVTVLSVVMILGFLFIITILGIKISNFNTTTRNPIEFPIQDIMVPDGKIENIYSVNVANPGFINIKFKDSFWNNFLKDIINNYKSFGVNNK